MKNNIETQQRNTAMTNKKLQQRKKTMKHKKTTIVQQSYNNRSTMKTNEIQMKHDNEKQQ